MFLAKEAMDDEMRTFYVLMYEYFPFQIQVCRMFMEAFGKRDGELNKIRFKNDMQHGEGTGWEPADV